VILSASLKARVLTALVAIPIALALFSLGRPVIDALIVLCAVLMMREWDSMVSGRSLGQLSGMDGLSLATIGSSLLLVTHDHFLIAAIIAGLGFVATFIARKEKRTWHSVGIAYIAVCVFATFFILTHLGISGFLWLLVTVWAIDIFAFAFGKVLGGPKIAPAISPNKTWAGLLGAMVGAVLSCWIFQIFSLYPMSFELFILAPLIAIVAQTGDFWESFVKRKFGVKDSSNILPGHGGLLDRMDGFVAASVLVAALIWAL
jgi:phosphatidate cytidylyltransferase